MDSKEKTYVYRKVACSIQVPPSIIIMTYHSRLVAISHRS